VQARLKFIAATLSTLALAATAGCTDAGADAEPAEAFSSGVLADGLSNPWELLLGPDGRLWVTERTAGRVTQVDLADGATTTVLEVPDVLITDGTQDGLLGMALHPALLSGGEDRFVYLSYTYDEDPGVIEERRAKIVRYTYDEAARQLIAPVELLTGIPASIDHNAGRLVFGPDEKLYYTIGDQGNNQFSRFCEPIQSQRLPTAAEIEDGDLTAYQGKILRLELDGSIPADNPVIEGVQSHVFTWGHRNPQGLVFAPDGRLFSAEHGPKSDDELNLIEPGGDYGWPHVLGNVDDRAYTYGNWSASEGPGCESLEYDDFAIPASVPQQAESEAEEDGSVPPVATFFTVDSDHAFADPQCSQVYFICWPTLAPSSLEYYSADGGVPGWSESLLLPSLKYGTVYRLPLDGDGVAEPIAMWETVNRYRDVAVGTEPTVFYVATDSEKSARGADGTPTTALEDPGAILRFEYTGEA
jgi:PQQ-dependent dehydrogenase (s-GDH family)